MCPPRLLTEAENCEVRVSYRPRVASDKAVCLPSHDKMSPIFSVDQEGASASFLHVVRKFNGVDGLSCSGRFYPN
ncbi:hypothetical protein TNCV_5042991 [Trichonephila clavipes]|nr:hypothetical protein TNCV_5042991 [Trichonephila clavipes]